MKRPSPHIDDLIGLDLPVGVSHAPLRPRAAVSEGTSTPGGYNGGRRDRRQMRNWRPRAGSADADTLLDLPTLRARSREAERNIPIAAGAISTTTTNVIGDGLQLQANIDAKALGITPEQADVFEQEQEREWALFGKSADFTTVQCFDEQQELAFRSARQSGDIIAIRRYRKDPGDAYGTKIQLIEADRLCNPDYGADSETISGGVEFNADGVPIAYHIARKHPGNLRVGGNTWERIPARDPEGRRLIVHLYDRTRPELSRGVPYLAPVIELLKQLGNYSDAEVTAAVVGAMVTMVIESPDAAPVFGETEDGLADDEVKLGNGSTLQLRPGEKANMLNPGRPNANFDPFVQAILQQVGVALELPLELLIKHFTASYSASKAALEMARMYFRKQRSRFAARFCHEVYGWMMDEAVASGRLNRPAYFRDPVIREAWLGANWIGPSMPSLNPQQEAAADEIDVRIGVKTREQICIERTGGEIEKKTEQLAREEGARKAAGLVPEPAPAAAPGQKPAKQDDSEAA